MAFLNRVGSLLKHNVSKHVTSSVSSASSPSLFQAMRSMCSYANTKVFVGGLAWGTDEPGLTQEFSKHGEVTEVRIITDRETGRSRGFGFVTFASADAASSAIKALDGQELQGRTIRVNLATERPRSGGYGGGGYGGGGGGYGGGGGGYGGGGGGYGGYNSGGGGGGYSGGGGGYGGYSGGGGNQGGNYSSGGDVGYSSGNQYSRGGGGGGGYPIGGSDGGFGAADSDNNPNFRSLLNDDTTGDVNHGPLGGDGGEIGAGNDDFGQDKDDVDYANTRN